jgi:hypothetical protein
VVSAYFLIHNKGKKRLHYVGQGVFFDCHQRFLSNEEQEALMSKCSSKVSSLRNTSFATDKTVVFKIRIVTSPKWKPNEPVKFLCVDSSVPALDMFPVIVPKNKFEDARTPKRDVETGKMTFSSLSRTQSIVTQELEKIDFFKSPFVHLNESMEPAFAGNSYEFGDEGGAEAEVEAETAEAELISNNPFIRHVAEEAPIEEEVPGESESDSESEEEAEVEVNYHSESGVFQADQAGRGACEVAGEGGSESSQGFCASQEREQAGAGAAGGASSGRTIVKVTKALLLNGAFPDMPRPIQQMLDHATRVAVAAYARALGYSHKVYPNGEVEIGLLDPRLFRFLGSVLRVHGHPGPCRLDNPTPNQIFRVIHAVYRMNFPITGRRNSARN